MESGTRASSKATVSGRESRTTRISESGHPQRPMDTECTTGQMAIDMKDSGTCA